MFVMLHYFFIILNHGQAVLSAIAPELFVINLHIAVAYFEHQLSFLVRTLTLKLTDLLERSLTIRASKL